MQDADCERLVAGFVRVGFYRFKSGTAFSASAIISAWSKARGGSWLSGNQRRVLASSAAAAFFMD